MSQAQATDVVTTYQDENGWKLKVNGNDFYVKGVVWGYTPRNENWSYNLWGNTDEFIRKVLDYDFGLMKAAGVNAIRSFTMIPPEWVTYIYKEHGIMTVINPLMGRYGYKVGGKWIVNTNYSDELTRTVLKADTLELVEKYKNVPGVLMFAFGNESNYGLSWSSFEIENLPEGEQNTEKAKYLYSLFNEVMAAGKRMDPNHPFTIVNGDLQYIDLIKEYCTDMDVLGTNMYRGTGFTDAWKDVKAKLDLPIVFMESGSDAFNALKNEEDQASQARFLKAQWQEMYNKSYGNGEEGNSIGGFVFEWRDEWWKTKVEEAIDLDVHNTTASWASGGYTYDYQGGLNNMNEEWWGITRLGKANADGVYVAEPRMAYDVMSEVWKMDPYTYKKEAFNQQFNNINMDYLALKSDVRQLKSDNKETKEIVHFSGGSIETKFILQGFQNDIKEQGEEGIDFQSGQMLFLDFEFQPTEKIDGQASLNFLGSVPDELIEISYGSRGDPVTVLQVETLTVDGVEQDVIVPVVVDDRNRVEIYDFDANYEGSNFDLGTFYHVPRYHWGYEGDFYGLLRETTDMAGEDIWNAKAPVGAEFIGKKSLEGLKIVAGPEIYWGANPKILGKYQWDYRDVNLSFIHSEDVARTGSSATATAATVRQSRATTLNIEKEFDDRTKLQVGLLGSASEKIDEDYTRLDGNDVVLDQIEFQDTLGIKAKLSFDLFGAQAYVAGNYAGLVADAGDAVAEFGTMLPYSQYGKKNEVYAGVMMNYGDWLVFPRVLWRENLVDANPIIPPEINNGVLFPGIAPRNTDDDPFAVLDNRAARAAEIMFTYDPTGGTFFYAWDNDKREDAKFAFNLVANYTQFSTDTDANLFFFEPTGSNASFGVGLPDENVWQVKSRLVNIPNGRVRFVTNLLAGFQQSDGTPEGGTRRFYEAEEKIIFDRKHILSAYIKKDAWGEYDFYRQFNVTYPWQYKLDYSYLLDGRADELTSSKIGIRALYRTLDSSSPEGEYQNGLNDYMFETIGYFTWSF